MFCDRLLRPPQRSLLGAGWTIRFMRSPKVGLNEDGAGVSEGKRSRGKCGKMSKMTQLRHARLKIAAVQTYLLN